MNKEQAESYIASLPKFTTKNSLEHTREFLVRLGDPQRNRKILHVAGTNGKGSVCAYLQAILLAEGKRTGMFISPHLEKINERIILQGKEISDEKFLQAFHFVLETVKEMEKEGIAHPSYFEFLFGMAMYAFMEADVEYIVLETGLGGRLDATNAVQNKVMTVITSITLDHMEILGDTIQKIAGEKAGILKEGVPVVCLDHKEYTEVIETRAEKLHAPCIKISKNAYEIIESTDKYIDFFAVNAYDKYVTWKLHNSGIYQVENAMLAIKAMEYLFPERKEMDLWQEAIASVVWQGRMEEIKPNVIVDGAHNIGAIEAFVKSIKQMKNTKNIILFSSVSDKDYENMIQYLCLHMKAESYIITEIPDARGETPERLAEVFRKYTKVEVIVEPDLSKALSCAMQKKGEDGKVYCLGSLYLVGKLKEL
ncbi:bifunctional folylpolyglutamate synthase/dihydrofolate synthase [Faecalimonas sp.]